MIIIMHKAFSHSLFLLGLTKLCEMSKAGIRISSFSRTGVREQTGKLWLAWGILLATVRVVCNLRSSVQVSGCWVGVVKEGISHWGRQLHEEQRQGACLLQLCHRVAFGGSSALTLAGVGRHVWGWMMQQHPSCTQLHMQWWSALPFPADSPFLCVFSGLAFRQMSADWRGTF